MPQQPARAISQKDLPPSVEAAYYRKCIDIRRRITDIEENNDGTRLRITRLNRGIQKLRLERAFLLEMLNKHMEYNNADDSDRSSSPPPTPTDKPLRSKRSHRKGTPPPAGSQSAAGGAGAGATVAPAQHVSPGSSAHPQQVLHQVNPLSSAQSTPDPSRQTNPFFSTVGAPSTSPHAVNGAAAGVSASLLPPLSSLPPLQQQTTPQQPLQQRAPEPSRPFFDPAYDEQRPAAAAPEHEGRHRAYSGPQAPPVEPIPQNGDTEMVDAAFPSANR